MRSPPGHGLAAERCPICFPKIGAAPVQNRPAQSPADDPVTCRNVCCRQAGTVTTVHAPLPQITRPRTGRTPRSDGGRKVTGTSEDGRLSSRISQRIRRRRNQRGWAKARSTTQRHTARSGKGAAGGLQRRGPYPRRERRRPKPSPDLRDAVVRPREDHRRPRRGWRSTPSLARCSSSAWGSERSSSSPRRPRTSARRPALRAAGTGQDSDGRTRSGGTGLVAPG